MRKKHYQLKHRRPTNKTKKQCKHGKPRKDTKVMDIRRLLDVDKRTIRNADGSVAHGNKKLATLRQGYIK